MIRIKRSRIANRISIENPATKAIAAADSCVDRLGAFAAEVEKDKKWPSWKNRPIVGPATIPNRMRAQYLGNRLGASVKSCNRALISRRTQTQAPRKPKARVNRYVLVIDTANLASNTVPKILTDGFGNTNGIGICRCCNNTNK